jgi:hypothetical protein
VKFTFAPGSLAKVQLPLDQGAAPSLGFPNPVNLAEATLLAQKQPLN